MVIPFGQTKPDPPFIGQTLSGFVDVVVVVPLAGPIEVSQDLET
jgi:hypothetical protein